jgi:hypothetical protein
VRCSTANLPVGAIDRRKHPDAVSRRIARAFGQKTVGGAMGSRFFRHSVCAMAVAFAMAAHAGAAVGPYTISFASFAPLDTDVFVADGDGSNARVLLAHPDLDYDATLTPDDEWVVLVARPMTTVVA